MNIINKLINDQDEKIGEEEIIDFEKYVNPKKEDKIQTILNLVNKIIIYESGTTKIIRFSPATIEQYIEFNKNSNIENLTFLNQIIMFIKKSDKKFEIKYKLDQLIHETGLNLIKNKILKNSEILDFISTDDYYQNKKY